MRVKKQKRRLNITIIAPMILLFIFGVFSQNLFAQIFQERRIPEDRRLFKRDDLNLLYPNTLDNALLPKIEAPDDSLNVRLVGRWANGPCYAVDVQDSIVYFGNGGYLEILDCYDPTNPLELGKILLPYFVRDVVVSGSYAYVADDNAGLRVIDVSDPSVPVEVGYFDTGGQALGVTVSGSYAYVADGNDGLRVIDVSDPSAPVETGYFDTEDSAVGVAVSGSYAYVTDEDFGLRVIDVSDPSVPVEMGYFDTGGLAVGIAVSGSYAYVADLDAGLRVIDVSDPSAPVEVGYFDSDGWAFGVAVSGSYVYVVYLDAGLRVIDVSDSRAPVEVGYFDTGGSANEVVVSGSYAYVADSDAGLRVIDVSDPSTPVETGYFNTVSSSCGVAVSGSYAYVANRNAGLRVIDVSDPSAPVEAGYFDTGGYAYGVTISGSIAYVADDFEGLRVIDVSDPSAPVEVGYFDTGGYVFGVAVSGSFAYVADFDVGLRVIDVSDPRAPVEVGYFDTGGSAYGVTVSGSYAYMADLDAGLRVIDVSDPSAPEEVGYFDSDGWAFGVAVSSSYAYVADLDAGLWVIDVSDPSAPVEVGYFDTGGSAYGVTVSGSYAYVADGNDGLYILEFIGPISGKPGTPLLTQPANNSFTNNNTHELTWNVPADNDGDLLHFKVEIATDSEFFNHISGSPFESQDDTSGLFNPTPPVAESSGQCSFTPSASLSDGDYWWRVTAWDGQEYSNPSSSRKFTIDTAAPYTSHHNPAADDTNVPLTTNIVVHVQDSTSGVNQSGIVMKINDENVSPEISGASSDYTLTYDPAIDFDYSKQITVSIDAEDNAGNQMETERYSFYTESMSVVSIPRIPTGLSKAKVGENVTFSSGGSISDLGGDLDYRFDWGDSRLSAWGDTLQSHIYLTAGTYTVKAQARSQLDTTILSNWSSGLTITLSGHLLEITLTGSGSVSKEPEKSEYNHAETVILTAVPSDNYFFDHWAGDLGGNSNPDSVIMESDISITAVFKELSETVSVLPNPFTPNDDGYNDYVAFKYPGMDTRKPVVRIFNLRGRKVNELNQFSGNEYHWDGKDENGKILEPGVYLYILEVENKKITSGTITLIR